MCMYGTKCLFPWTRKIKSEKHYKISAPIASRDEDSNSKCDFESEFEYEQTKCIGNVTFSLNMNLNTNSEGCVTLCVHDACVDMYDHIVGLVVYHPSSCSLCNHKRTNRIH
jgi:hypothetical protein